MQKVFHCPGVSGIIYLLSIISGYPVGAKLTSQLFTSGTLTREEVVRINAFTSTSGPLFIIGTVGVGMFVNHTCGIIMLIAHIIGAFSNGLLYRNYHYKTKSAVVQTKQLNNADEIISKTMYDSIISILIVGGYIVIFNIIIDMLFNLGVLQFFEQVLGGLLSVLNINESVSSGIVSGILEVPRGCKDLASSGANIRLITTLACALISWGGFSIHLQALTFLNKCNISIPFYLLQKLTQSLLSGFICAILVLIFV